MESKKLAWLFVYICPHFLDDPAHHLVHVRWTVINDYEEARLLAEGIGLAWPAASAKRGCVSFVEVCEDVENWDAFAEQYLEGLTRNHRWFKAHYDYSLE